MSNITIAKTEYAGLLKDSAKLQKLESGGVDNWEWYSESLEGLDEEFLRIDEEFGA